MKTNKALKFILISLGYLLAANSFADPLRSTVKSIRGYGTDTYYVRFFRGYRARVAIVGNGSTNLDMYIYDKYGNLVCYDSSYRDQFVCRWTPRRTGRHKIVLRNRGGYYNRYAIATN